MSVPDQVPVVETVANGNTVVFPFNFMVVLDADLDVLVDGVLKVLGADYSVAGVGVAQGGSVTFIPAAKPANGQRVTLRRNTPVSRATNYSDNGDLPAETLNQDFDRLWLALQEQRAIFSTSITRPVGGQSGWDAQNFQLVNLKDGTNPQDAATVKQLTQINGSAGQSANAAAQSATAALASQNAASGSAGQAANSAAAALAAQNLAQKWAAENEDVPVQGGLFSARHYAAKASGSAAAASGSASAAGASESAAAGRAAAALVSQNAAAVSATSAKADADRAQSANPDEQLKKAQNLADLPDKDISRNNLDVYSKAEVDGKGGGYIGRAFWHPLRTSVPGGNSPGDGQVVNRTGAYASLWAECAAGRLPVVTDAVWLADPTKRGCYSSGDGSTTFRFPDYNGVQPGSIPAPVMRGDGGLTDGTIQQNAAPNILGDMDAAAAVSLQTLTGAFRASGNNYYAAQHNTGTTQIPTHFSFDASRSSAAYGRDGTAEVRGNSIVGCWVVQFAGVANNAGSIDALALATRIEQVAQSVTTTAARFDRQGVSAWVAMSVNPTTLAITILDSFNVAGVTRNTVGTYTISFATNMLSTNYGWDGSMKSSSSAIAVHNMYASLSDTKTVSQMVVRTAYATATTGGAFDPSELTVIFVGGK